MYTPSPLGTHVKFKKHTMETSIGGTQSAKRLKGMSDSTFNNTLSTPNRSILSDSTSENSLRTPNFFNSFNFDRPDSSLKGGSQARSLPRRSSCQPKYSDDTSCGITVAVRVRPFSSQELLLEDLSCVVSMDDNTATVSSDSGIPTTFAFDYCFWSFDESTGAYADQTYVYETLAQPMLAKAFEGYNTCLFAYGQTGSGKSYSIMGQKGNLGVIPRFCEEMFMRIESLESDKENSLLASVKVSYFEIYNEKIHDLLTPYGKDNQAKGPNLKVREHPITGPYVEGLSSFPVNSFEEIENWLNIGNKQRATAATGINEKSSRSHAVFTLVLTQKRILPGNMDRIDNIDHEHSITSKINLVDLAGSERQNVAGTSGKHLREGSSINKSLLTLGKVISQLSGKKSFISYRDSVLTWLLKESLGGNSHTTMLATISPANFVIEETLNTLRYARQALSIINKAHINEDPKAKIIRELREQNEKLRHQMGALSEEAIRSSMAEIAALREQLSDREREINEIKKSDLELDVCKGVSEQQLAEEQQKIEDARRELLEELERVSREKERATHEAELEISIQRHQFENQLATIEETRKKETKEQKDVINKLKSEKEVLEHEVHFIRERTDVDKSPEIELPSPGQQSSKFCEVLENAKTIMENETLKLHKALHSVKKSARKPVNPAEVTRKDIYKIALHLREANKMSQHLGKDIVFSREDSSDGDDGDVLIRVTDTNSQRSCLWSVEKFNSRLLQIRELFQQAESSTNLNDYDELFNDPDDKWQLRKAPRTSPHFLKGLRGSVLNSSPLLRESIGSVDSHLRRFSSDSTDLSISRRLTGDSWDSPFCTSLLESKSLSQKSVSTSSVFAAHRQLVDISLQNFKQDPDLSLISLILHYSRLLKESSHQLSIHHKMSASIREQQNQTFEQNEQTIEPADQSLCDEKSTNYHQLMKQTCGESSASLTTLLALCKLLKHKSSAEMAKKLDDLGSKIGFSFSHLLQGLEFDMESLISTSLDSISDSVITLGELCTQTSSLDDSDITDLVSDQSYNPPSDLDSILAANIPTNAEEASTKHRLPADGATRPQKRAKISSHKIQEMVGVLEKSSTSTMST